jgi:hypothetical protein
MFFQDVRNLTSYYIVFAVIITQTLYKRLHKNNLPPPPKL